MAGQTNQAPAAYRLRTVDGPVLAATKNRPASSREASDPATAESIRAGGPNPTPVSGRTAIAATPMPANQIAATRSRPGIGTLRVPVVSSAVLASVIVSMFEPGSGGLETLHALHQRAYRHIDADT